MILMIGLGLMLSGGAAMASDVDAIDASSPEAFDQSVAAIGSELEGAERREFALALTAVSLQNAQAIANEVQVLMREGYSEAEIDQARADLFTQAFAPVDGMSVSDVVTEGRAIAQENNMTLEDLGGMLDDRILNDVVPE
jgi:hypothetical protein